MLIGHLPAGYLLTKGLLKKLKLPYSPWWFGLGLAAAIFPDLDFAYWYFFNYDGSNHHNYISHISFFYLMALLLCLLIYQIFKKAWLKFGLIIVFLNIFLHLILDSCFTGIKWLWPFAGQFIGIYNVGGSGGLLVDNYLAHWYWYLELALWVWAILTVILSYRKGEIK